MNMEREPFDDFEHEEDLNTPEHHEARRKETVEFLNSWLEEAKRAGQPLHLVYAGSYEFGSLLVSKHEDSYPLAAVFASPHIKHPDWKAIAEEALSGNTDLVLPTKRITRGAIRQAIPNFFRLHYQEVDIEDLQIQVEDHETVGGGVEFVSEFDRYHHYTEILKWVLKSYQDKDIFLRHDTAFKKNEYVDVYFSNGTENINLVTIYGEAYTKEFEKEGISPFDAFRHPRHYVVQGRDYLTEEYISEGIEKYLAEHFEELAGLPIRIENEEQEPLEDFPQPAFVEGIFTPDHWQDPVMNSIRKHMIVWDARSLFHRGVELPEVDLIDVSGNLTKGGFSALEVNGKHGGGALILGFEEDQRYALIRSDRVHTWFYLSWYKSRTATEAFNYLKEKDGEFIPEGPVAYEDAVYLANFLEEIEQTLPISEVEIKKLHTHVEIA